MSVDALAALSPEQVEQFLIENPTFFLKREHLLNDLYLPYASKGAVSLQEKQVSILRERNIDTRKRLSDIIEQGQRNDVIFNKTRDLILTILSAKSMSDLSQRINSYCQTEFNIDSAQLSLFAHDASANTTQTRTIAINEVERSMPSLLKSSECISGAFRKEERQFLFAHDYEKIASAIILPIYQKQQLVAMLALGSKDTHYFQAGMDTLFLNFVGDVISKLLSRFNFK